MSIYTPTPATVYGRTENRLKVNNALHLPQKASNVVDSVDTSPQIFLVGTELRYYVNGSFYSVPVGSGQITDTNFANTPLTFTGNMKHFVGTSYQLEMVSGTFDYSGTTGAYTQKADLVQLSSQLSSTKKSIVNTNSTGVNKAVIETVDGSSKMSLEITASTFTMAKDGGTKREVPRSVNGIYAGSTGDISLGTIGTAKIVTVASVTEAQGITGASASHLIMYKPDDYYDNVNGIYTYNPTSGEIHASGPGYWKRELQTGLISTSEFNSPLRLQVWSKASSGYSHNFSASAPPMFLVLKNDSSELPNNAWGAMVSGSAAGGAMLFTNDYSNTANRKLQLGLIDVAFAFTPMIDFSYSSVAVANAITLRNNIIPYTTDTISLGIKSLPLRGIAFRSKSGAPIATDLTDGLFTLYKDTAGNTFDIWMNDGGTMKKFSSAIATTPTLQQVVDTGSTSSTDVSLIVGNIASVYGYNHLDFQNTTTDKVTIKWDNLTGGIKLVKFGNFTGSPTVPTYIPFSVNGIAAGVDGNITLPSISTPNLQQTTDQGSSTTNPMSVTLGTAITIIAGSNIVCGKNSVDKMTLDYSQLSGGAKTLYIPNCPTQKTIAYGIVTSGTIYSADSTGIISYPVPTLQNVTDSNNTTTKAISSTSGVAVSTITGNSLTLAINASDKQAIRWDNITGGIKTLQLANFTSSTRVMPISITSGGVSLYADTTGDVDISSIVGSTQDLDDVLSIGNTSDVGINMTGGALNMTGTRASSSGNWLYYDATTPLSGSQAAVANFYPSIIPSAAGGGMFATIQAWPQLGASSYALTSLTCYRAGANVYVGSSGLTNIVGYRFSSPQNNTSNTIGAVYGFYCENIGTAPATSRIAFDGMMVAGTGNWNLYMEGSAPNYLSGVTYIGSPTDQSTGAKLQITGGVSSTGSIINTGGNPISAYSGSTPTGVNGTLSSDSSSGMLLLLNSGGFTHSIRSGTATKSYIIQMGTPGSGLASGGTAYLPISVSTGGTPVFASSTGDINITSLLGVGGTVSSVSAGNTGLTIAPSTGAVVASLNLANANVWTNNQTINKTTEQFRLRYDSTNYTSFTVDSAGKLTIDTNALSNGVILAGGFCTNSTGSSGSNLGVPTALDASSTSTTDVALGGAALTSFRVCMRGINSTVIGANNSYANVVVGSSPVTEAGSGTHVIFANLAVKPIGTITGAAAALTNTATLYVEAAGSGATNNYSLWIDAGISRFDGQIQSAAGTTAASSLRIQSGVAPTSPVTGDMWYDGTTLKFRNGAVTESFGPNFFSQDQTLTSNRTHTINSTLAVTFTQGSNFIRLGDTGDGQTFHVDGTIGSSANIIGLGYVQATTYLKSINNIVCNGVSSPSGTVAIEVGNSNNAVHLRLVPTTGISTLDGAIWYDGTNLKMRVGGVTKTFTLT